MSLKVLNFLHHMMMTASLRYDKSSGTLFRTISQIEISSISFHHIKVLFLECADLMGPLTTLAHCNRAGNFQSLKIHLSHSYSAATARNIFILKTICSPNFAPNNEADLNYIWDLMNNATWKESTHKRFTEDVKNLRDSPLPQNIIIPESFHEELRDLCTEWLAMMEDCSVEDVLADRYNHDLIINMLVYK